MVVFSRLPHLPIGSTENMTCTVLEAGSICVKLGTAALFLSLLRGQPKRAPAVKPFTNSHLNFTGFTRFLFGMIVGLVLLSNLSLKIVWYEYLE